MIDPAWVHVKLAYEMLLFILNEPENRVPLKELKRIISRQFVGRMMHLFQSEDARERLMMQKVLHRIYGRFKSYRPFIRQSIRNEFHMFVYESNYHCGIAEILEILVSIINGFSLPVRPEHVDLLETSLLPLMITSQLRMFYPQLLACLSQYIEKGSCHLLQFAHLM